MSDQHDPLSMRSMIAAVLVGLIVTIAGGTVVNVLTHSNLPPPIRADDPLSASARRNVWFVIAGSELRLDDAMKKATVMNQTFPGYHAEVYDRRVDNPYYAVVIGANLTQSEARALRDKARRDGLAPDIYFKTFPSPPSPLRLR